MKNAFNLNYGNCSFMLKKEDVHFVNGYGIVVAELEEDFVLGVVDKNFKEVLPLTSSSLAYKFFVASNGNFVFLAFNSELEDYQVIHKDVNGFVINLEASDFEPIDDEVIVLYFDDYIALYDTQTRELNTHFNYIGPFVYSDKYGCRVARAGFLIEDKDKKVINEISTLINAKGEVLENYFDLARGEEIVCRDSTEVLNLVRKTR